jgi:hypothetical protein
LSFQWKNNLYVSKHRAREPMIKVIGTNERTNLILEADSLTKIMELQEMMGWWLLFQSKKRYNSNSNHRLHSN